MTRPETARKKRANGVESRQRILDAAVEIAGERGYDGTSIAAVSAKCGLPASSIYWHFKDKDDLIAAVIERSFEAWLTAVELPGEETGTPLERRPTEPRGRTAFLQVRDITHRKIAEVAATLFPGLDEQAVDTLTTYAIAGADGLFVQREVKGESVDLVALFELHAQVVHDAAARMAAGR
jgi:AcrR family transcriptional regulator